MSTFLTGTKALDNILTALRKYNLESQDILDLAPNETQFMSFLLKASYDPTDDAEWKSKEHDPVWRNRWFYAAGAGTWSSNAIANLAIDDGAGNAISWLTAGDQVRIRHAAGGNDTVAVITNVDSTTQIDLRSQPGAGSNETNIANNDLIYLVSSSMGEQSKAKTGLAHTIASNTFYCSDMEDAVSMSDVARAARTFGPEEWGWQLLQTFKNHKAKLNGAMLLSALDKETITINNGGETVRSTIGLITSLEDNTATLMNAQGVQTPSFSNYTWDDLVDDANDLFDAGSTIKPAICGRHVLAFFQKFGLGTVLGDAQINVAPMTNSFGVNIVKLTIGANELHLVPDQTLRNSSLYGYWMAVPDMEYVKYRPLVGHENLDTHIVRSVATSDDFRNYKDTFRTVAGLEVVHHTSHGLFKFTA